LSNNVRPLSRIFKAERAITATDVQAFVHALTPEIHERKASPQGIYLVATFMGSLVDAYTKTVEPLSLDEAIQELTTQVEHGVPLNQALHALTAESEFSPLERAMDSLGAYTVAMVDETLGLAGMRRADTAPNFGIGKRSRDLHEISPRIRERQSAI
jgi:hypothetical protein